MVSRDFKRNQNRKRTHDGPHMHRGDNPCYIEVGGVACGNNDDIGYRFSVPEPVWILCPITGNGVPGHVTGFADEGWYYVESSEIGEKMLLVPDEQLVSAALDDTDFWRHTIQMHGGDDFLTGLACGEHVL